MEKRRDVSTFCRVCEPTCGVLASVEDGRITKILSNPDHVSAKGHFCKKAMGAVDITYDPDRVLYPLKRNGAPGEFERVSWEQAFSEIAARLKAIRNESGQAAFATYIGNPPAFASANALAHHTMAKALGVKWRYSVNFEDAVPFVAAVETLFGKGSLTRPDFWRSHFALIVGGNPVGSHGSLFCEPIVGKALKSIVDRGGRVIAVDPYCSETAHRFEHQPILAGSDPYFLSALLKSLIDQGFVDSTFVEKHTSGFDRLCQSLAPCSEAWGEHHSGIPAETIRDLAKQFGSAKSACIYGRTGTCTQRHGTLANILMHLIATVTGNLDSEGGFSFGCGFVDSAGPRIGKTRSRTTGLPDVGGSLPSVALPSDIQEPGDEQVRALMMVGANPALAAPVGGRLCEAVQQLDLFFSLDLYVNETNRFADFVLPCTTMWEREDVPFVAMLGMMLRPSMYATAPVIEPLGEAREEWEIYYELCNRLGRSDATAVTPHDMIDRIIRKSQFGDKYGENPDGLNYDKLLNDYPNGVELMEHMPVGVLEKFVANDHKLVHLAAPEFVSEMDHLFADGFYERPEFPLRLHSLREALTHNTWMHNAKSLAKSRWDHYARISAEDADRYGIDDDSEVWIRSPYGETRTTVRISKRISPGNVALPHGWGHQGGWQLANQRGGVNANILASDSPDDGDRVSGGSVLNGIPINVSPF